MSENDYYKLEGEHLELRMAKNYEIYENESYLLSEMKDKYGDIKRDYKSVRLKLEKVKVKHNRVVE